MVINHAAKDLQYPAHGNVGTRSSLRGHRACDPLPRGEVVKLNVFSCEAKNVSS